MRADRWFNVLVLGGAALGNACVREAAEAGSSPEGHSGAAPSAVGDVVNGGSGSRNTDVSSGSTSGGGPSSGGIASASRGATSSGAAGTSSGEVGGASEAGSGPSSPMGGDAAAGGSSGSSGGSAGGATGLVCHTDAKGFGRSSDPCGCSCCWARDCQNTDACCAGFCKGADSGRGCCAP